MTVDPTNSDHSGPADIDEKLRQVARVQVDRSRLAEEILKENGMEAGKPLTEEQCESIRARVKGFMHERKWTFARLAAKINVDKNVIKRVMLRTYKGDPEPVLRQLAMLANLSLKPKDQAQGRKDPDRAERDRYVEIGIVRDINGTVSEAVELCRAGTPYMALITGPAGCGKSMALKGIARCYPFSTYLCITEATARCRPFLRTLGHSLGLSGGLATIGEAFASIINKLRGQYRLLIFDELHLADKRLLNIIREIMDQSSCPIVLAGQPALERIIFEGRTDRSRGATIYRRVGPKLNVEDLIVTRTTRGPDGVRRVKAQRKFVHTPGDVMRIVQSLRLNVRMAKDVMFTLMWVANHPEGGMLGTLVGLLCHCVHCNPGEERLTNELLAESMRRWNTIAEFQYLSEMMQADPLAVQIRESLKRKRSA